jgi:peptidoglycan/LPS O-acetylase OafA/YrhL
MTTLTGSDQVSPAEPYWLRTSRIPSLDGIRAVSIILVTIAHLIPAPGSPFPSSWRSAAYLGALGVDVFFVISGFLITHLLIRERAKTNTVSLSGFYLRRSLRIFPAYFFFLAVVFVFNRAGWLLVARNTWLPALTYTYNLIPGLSPLTIGHLWSLCVEEHFYLMWPVLFLALKRRAPLPLLFSFVLAVALRFVLWERFRAYVNIDLFTLTRIDTIAVGCLMAFIAHDPRGWPLLHKMRGRGDLIAVLSFLLVLASVFVFSRSGKYALGPKHLVEGVAIAVFVSALVNDPESVLGRWLNGRFLVTVGVMSYSLYLGQFLTNPVPPWPISWWLNIPLTIAYAWCSYRCVELPMLRIRDRIVGRGRSGVQMAPASAITGIRGL